MKRNIKFDSSNNPAKNFGIMVKDLERIAQETDVPLEKVISDFMLDLKNYYKEDYEKKVEDVEISGDISQILINGCVSYLSKLLKAQKQKERQEKKRQKKIDKKRTTEAKEQEMENKWKRIELLINELVSGGKEGTEGEIIERILSNIDKENLDNKEKKHILKRLNDRLAAVKQKETQIVEDKTNAEKIMQEIEKIVEREFNQDNIESKPKYWMSIRDAIAGEEGNNPLNMQIGKSAEKILLKMIDERIDGEKDLLYYEQVKYFTRDFRFLKENSEIIRATNGAEKRKFTDREAYNRFIDLRSLLQEGHNEYIRINRLLENGNIDDGDRRILEARIKVMDREIEAKCQDKVR